MCTWIELNDLQWKLSVRTFVGPTPTLQSWQSHYSIGELGIPTVHVRRSVAASGVGGSAHLTLEANRGLTFSCDIADVPRAGHGSIRRVYCYWSLAVAAGQLKIHRIDIWC